MLRSLALSTTAVLVSFLWGTRVSPLPLSAAEFLTEVWRPLAYLADGSARLSTTSKDRTSGSGESARSTLRMTHRL